MAIGKCCPARFSRQTYASGAIRRLGVDVSVFARGDFAVTAVVQRGLPLVVRPAAFSCQPVFVRPNAADRMGSRPIVLLLLFCSADPICQNARSHLPGGRSRAHDWMAINEQLFLGKRRKRQAATKSAFQASESTRACESARRASESVRCYVPATKCDMIGLPRIFPSAKKWLNAARAFVGKCGELLQA